MKCNIDKSKRLPIYEQITQFIENEIESGKLKVAEQLPSINQIAQENILARETVVKAYKILQHRGIIKAVHGKGYFVRSSDIEVKQHVFLLLDTLMAYKETVYRSIVNKLGHNAVVDVYFHHYNIEVFNKLLSEAVGNYTSYIVVPFDHKSTEEILSIIPANKLLLADRFHSSFSGKYRGVWQDFETDIYQLLTSNINLVRKYKTIELIFRNTSTDVPKEIKTGFVNFCKDNDVKYKVCSEDDCAIIITPQTGYIVIDDTDLVNLIEQAKEQNLVLGSDYGILSYNDTALKKVVANGVSVISSDFKEMGNRIAEMILTGNTKAETNSFQFINRNSF